MKLVYLKSILASLLLLSGLSFAKDKTDDLSPDQIFSVVSNAHSIAAKLHQLSPERRVRHVVFDIDWTITSEVPMEMDLPSDWKTVIVQGKKYRVGDHLGAMMKSLVDNPVVKISFFSGGQAERNRELLSKIKPPELGGKSLLDVAHRVLSFSDLEEAHPEKTVFAERYAKDLFKVSHSPADTVLIEDSLSFLKIENSSRLKGLWTGASFAFYPTYEDALEAEKQGAISYAPKTFEEFVQERNRLARVHAILTESLKESQKTGRPFLDLVREKGKESVSEWTNKGMEMLKNDGTPKIFNFKRSACFHSIFKAFQH